jgi:peptidoglycan/LPS O-acetylase OafA/YrhL
VVAAVAYSTNWTQITWNRSYFAQLGPPSLLQHLWSLAVEEQFYLLWPLILATCLAFRRRFVSVAVVALALVGVSSLLMAVLFHPGQDPSRVYYGTDTHIAPMLLGAALAALAQRRASRAWRIWARLAADLVALGALVVLGHAAAQVAFTSAGLYRGEYLVVWLAASVLVFAAAIPRTATATVLGLGVPRWLGERSYAIYLWHSPILVLCRDRTDLPLRGPPLVVAQLVAIVVAAGLSYRFVEHPIRTNGLLATLRGVTHHPHRGSTAQRRVHRRHRPLLVGLTLTGVIASVAMTLVSA